MFYDTILNGWIAQSKNVELRRMLSFHRALFPEISDLRSLEEFAMLSDLQVIKYKKSFDFA